MNREALRLLGGLSDAIDRADARSQEIFCELRALLSAQEPTAEHWRQAIREEIGEVVISVDELLKIERRARELAKQEAK